MNLEDAKTRIAAIMKAADEPDEGLRRAARVLAELMDADGATITLVEDDALRYVAAEGSADLLLGRTRPLANSFTGDVVLLKRARVFEPRDARASSRGRARMDEISSGAVAPLICDGMAGGTVGVTSRTARAFGPQELADLQALADVIGANLHGEAASPQSGRPRPKVDAAFAALLA